MIHYICYTSIQSIEFDNEKLIDLFIKCKKNNIRNEITGMLLYSNGKFIQYFEGEKEDVKNLYDLISNDNRHESLVKIVEGLCLERQYSEWNMAFESLDEGRLINALGLRDFDLKTLFSVHGGKELLHPGIVLLRTFIKNNKNRTRAIS